MQVWLLELLREHTGSQCRARTETRTGLCCHYVTMVKFDSQFLPISHTWLLALHWTLPHLEHVEALVTICVASSGKFGLVARMLQGHDTQIRILHLCTERASCKLARQEH